MVDLVVRPDGLRRGSSGAVTGPIHFVVGEDCFPEEGWSDFPIVIVGWWLEAVGRLERGFSQAEDLNFMDGPYLVQAFLGSDGGVDLKFCAERGQGLVEMSESVPLERLIEIVRRAGAVLSEACARQGWSDRDVDALSRAGVG